jgi:hypothetical protein
LLIFVSIAAIIKLMDLNFKIYMSKCKTKSSYNQINQSFWPFEEISQQKIIEWVVLKEKRLKSWKERSQIRSYYYSWFLKSFYGLLENKT